MSFVSHNGKLVPQNTPLVNADNSSFKWGDGIFETIKVLNSKILLEPYHFERLKKGLEVLAIQHDDKFINRTKENIYELCRQNKCLQISRVRLAVYRNSEGVAETIIQAGVPALGLDAWNDEGWTAGIFKNVIKSLDALSNVKTASYLPYILAGRYAREMGLDESIILNSRGTVCDGSRTNIFIISGDKILTPALEEGCVAGVMRRHVLTELARKGMPVAEDSITMKALLQADEMFVTNAIIGIKWIEKLGPKSYSNKQTFKLYQILYQ